VGSTLRRELPALLVLGAATVVATRPLAWRWDQVLYQRDALFGLLAMKQLQDHLASALPWGEPRMGWPIEPGFAQADWMLGQALLAMPLEALGLHPIDAYRLLVLLGLLATAWVCHLAAQALLGPGPHTWLAGLIGGLGPAQLCHAQHVNLVHHEWAVGGTLLMAIGLARQRPWLAALGGLAVGLGFHFGFYMGLHGLLLAGVLLAVAAIARRIRLAGGLAAGAGLVAGSLSFLPIGLSYARYARQHQAWMDPGELTTESWDLASTLHPISGAWLHRPLLSELATPIMDPPNPGYLAVLMALVGLALVRRRGLVWLGVALAGLLAALLSLGPSLMWDGHEIGLPGPYRLLAALPGGEGLRAPARWLALSFAAVGLFAAAGARGLLSRLPAAWRPVAALPILLLLLGEVPVVETGPREQIQGHSVYLALEAMPAGPLYEHFHGIYGTCHCDGAPRLAEALEHRRPIVGGRWARESAALRAIEGLAGRWPAAEAAEMLSILGVPVVIEHPPVMGSPPSGASCAMVDDHRVCALEPQFPGGLPRESQVETLGHGPVVGLRLLSSPESRRLEIRCERQRPWRTTTRAWKLLAQLRHGAQPPWLDVYLPTPCPTVPEISEGSPLPLYAVQTRSTP
jgi:hypothetical protein